MARAAESRTLRDEAYEIVEEMIITHILKPGDKITELDLAKQIGIGRTPVREALQRLASQGLISIKPRSEIVVLEMSIEKQANLVEYRATVEQLLIRCAIRRADDEQRILMQQLASAVEEAGKLNEILFYLKVVGKLQTLMCAAAGNLFIASSMRAIYAQSRQFTYFYYRSAGNLRRGAALHARVLRAIAARDEAGAEKAFNGMIQYMREFLERSARGLPSETDRLPSLLLPDGWT